MSPEYLEHLRQQSEIEDMQERVSEDLRQEFGIALMEAEGIAREDGHDGDS